MRTPLRQLRQVIVLTDFHLVDEAAPMLLKTIEEPPETTVFRVARRQPFALPLVTIASRSVRVELFGGRARCSDRADLERRGGRRQQIAIERCGVGAGGRIDRARLLASDAGFSA